MQTPKHVNLPLESSQGQHVPVFLIVIADNPLPSSLYLQTIYLWKLHVRVINERILKAKKIPMPGFSKIKKWRKHVVLPFSFLFPTPVLFSKYLFRLVLFFFTILRQES